MENEDCKTKYPVVMVHGIFFVTGSTLTIGGVYSRIYADAMRQFFCGGQQSAAPVATSAEELTEKLKAILTQTHEEKVNIIAHSKGGLDSRYAISKLGKAPYVASLTTINTPHRGCVFVEHLLNVLPKLIQDWIESCIKAWVP